MTKTKESTTTVHMNNGYFVEIENAHGEYLVSLHRMEALHGGAKLVSVYLSMDNAYSKKFKNIDGVCVFLFNANERTPHKCPATAANMPSNTVSYAEYMGQHGRPSTRKPASSYSHFVIA